MSDSVRPHGQVTLSTGFSRQEYWKSESEVAQSCPILCDPMDWIAYQAPLSIEFSRQEYWSGLPFPSQGIFLTQGSNLSLPHRPALQADALPLSHQGYQTVG